MRRRRFPCLEANGMKRRRFPCLEVNGRRRRRFPCLEVNGMRRRRFPCLEANGMKRRRFPCLEVNGRRRRRFPCLEANGMFQAWWLMEGEGKIPFHLFPLSPQPILLKLSIFPFDFKVLLYHGIRLLLTHFLPFLDL
jgi:hypothetical protein